MKTQPCGITFVEPINPTWELARIAQIVYRIWGKTPPMFSKPPGPGTLDEFIVNLCAYAAIQLGCDQRAVIKYFSVRSWRFKRAYRWGYKEIFEKMRKKNLIQ